MSAGRRLQGAYRTDYPEPLLREFARDVLGACRIRPGYLEALRVVLGNQAQAERWGYTLQQNIRVDFATEREMRTINDQMKQAGITRGKAIVLGPGLVQTVQRFRSGGRGPDLCTLMRMEEAVTDKLPPTRATVPADLLASEVPY